MDVLPPFLQGIDHLSQEIICGGSIQDAVIKSQSDVDHWADSDTITTGSVGNYHYPFLQLSDAEDATLGLIDDRCGK